MSSFILGSVSICNYRLLDEIDYLNSIEKLPEAYDEFGQGCWKNISLYNATGDAVDSQYRNAPQCHPTAFGRRCPELQRLLTDTFQTGHLKMVRARSLVDGMVIPHRDFVELDRAHRYQRVFIALQDNPQAYHSDESGVFQMLAGEVWSLDASIDHAAVNFGSASRMCLCLDFISPQPLQASELFAPAAAIHAPRKAFHVHREPLSARNRDWIIAAVARVVCRRTFKDLVFALSKYHFVYDIPVSCCYDWIIAAAETAGDIEVMNKAVSLRRYLLQQREVGERFSLDEWGDETEVVQ